MPILNDSVFDEGDGQQQVAQNDPVHAFASTRQPPQSDQTEQDQLPAGDLQIPAGRQPAPREDVPKTGTPLDFLRPDQLVRLRAKAMQALRTQTGDPPAKVSAMNSRKLFDKILSGEMPDRSAIDEEYLAPIKRPADPGRGISKADHEWLISQFENGKTVDGRSEQERQKDVFDAAKHLLKNPLEGLPGQIDEGPAKYDVFRYDLQKKIQERKQDPRKGKVMDLFDPGSPDYVLAPNNMEIYRRSLQDVLHDQNRIHPAPPPPEHLGLQPKMPNESINQWKARTKYAPKIGEGLTPEMPPMSQ